MKNTVIKKKSKVISADCLAARLRSLRGRRKIVFTNGCFDILHRGHVEYLAKAKSLGDVLVLGVNTDASVRRLKGPSRPVTPMADRARVLAALESVDFVVPFAEDTPDRLIRAVRPDVLVKGADWKSTDIVGAKFLRGYGGRVVRVKLTPGRSTTSVIQNIQDASRREKASGGGGAGARVPGGDRMSRNAGGGAGARVLVVIPARYASTRFPGKPLEIIGNKTILQHVHEKALRASRGEWKVIIATDDSRIRDAALRFGADVRMTPVSCRSGSDRCAAVARSLPGFGVIVNLQGDEPFQSPENIRLAVRALLSSDAPVATLVTRCSRKDLNKPNVAKVAVSGGRAIFFSRSMIPYHRDTKNGIGPGAFFKHIGLYVFRRDFLLKFSGMKPTPLENAEKLEQLRILEHGFPIAVAFTKRDSIGIDTPDDLRRARRLV